MIHCTYAHKKPDGSIFYIGKGSIKRAYSDKGRNIVWQRTVKKYGSFSVTILAKWEKEEDAFSHEILLIESLKDMGIPLVNIAKGGKGSCGFRHTKEHKEKMSKLMKENNPMDNENYRKKQYENLKIAMNRPEIRKKQSDARIGKKLPKNHIESLKKCHPMKKCIINGVIYISLMEASRQLNIRHGTLYRWMNNQSIKHEKQYAYITECRWI